MEKKKWKVRKPKEAKVSPKLKPKLIALVEEPPSYHLKNAHLKPEMLQINDEDDKERCDELTGQLIECFYDYLQAEQKVPQKRATRYAYIVDHYARDFLIPYGAYTVLDYEPGFIHTFLGNWYIRKNMSPELDYIYASLQALSAFYAFLFNIGWIDRLCAEEAIEECRDYLWYKQRLERYWQVSKEDFVEWIDEYNYEFL